jgi:dienelactone hydrolase
MTPRKDISFQSGGQTCRGWLFLPDAGNAKPPLIVLGHGLGAVKEMGLDAYAERFTARGYACLAFDYRHFGASDGEPRQLLDIDQQLQDWQSAIDYARALPEVDGKRVVLWGSSFGGGHALVAGSRDTRVAAIISQCPFTDGIASALTVDFRTSIKLTVLALLDAAGALFGRKPIYVPLAAAPGELGLMNSHDAESGYLALVPKNFTFRNETAARVLLHIIGYCPGRIGRGIRSPTLLCVCDTDTVAPARATLRHARKIKTAEVKVYHDGHFDIYVGDSFERVIADQIDFLTRKVPVNH